MGIVENERLVRGLGDSREQVMDVHCIRALKGSRAILQQLFYDDWEALDRFDLHWCRLLDRTNSTCCRRYGIVEEAKS